MKKVAFLLVVVMLLLMSSVVALAAQPNQVSLSSGEELDSGVCSDKIWVMESRVYSAGQSIPSTIMYDSGGYTGILYFQSAIVFHGGVIADYAGWAYSGSVQPWSITEY